VYAVCFAHPNAFAEFPLISEGVLCALYGDRQIQISCDLGQIVGETRARNGAFNTLIKSDLLNRNASAVALYREQLLESSFTRHLYVYHNPYALNPIPEEIFSGLPQFLFLRDEEESERMQWLNEISPWDE